MTDNTATNHYSLLQTIEQNWNLPYLGNASDTLTVHSPRTFLLAHREHEHHGPARPVRKAGAPGRLMKEAVDLARTPPSGMRRWTAAAGQSGNPYRDSMR